MTITASRQLYEVNLYCELFYPEHETEQGRYELGLCDYNLIFLTELDESSSTIDLLKDLNSRFPNEMDEFFREVVEEHIDASISFHGEYRYPQDEVVHLPDEDDLYVVDNYCPYGEIY